MDDNQRLHLRCQMLEIEKSCAVLRCEEYRNLLEQFTGGAGPTREGEEREQPIASSSRSVPTTPPGPTSTTQRQRMLPSLMGRRNDQSRRRHQSSVLLQHIFECHLRDLFRPALVDPEPQDRPS